MINGQEIWIGNDDVEPRTIRRRYPGVLKNLEAAIDKRPARRRAGPPGSKGIVVITYATGADDQGPDGRRSTTITGGALGSQKDYFGTRSAPTWCRASTLGARRAATRCTTARKVLIVVGDGNDTNNEAAKGQLADAQEAGARASSIQMFAIIYKCAVSSDGNVITTMIPQTPRR